MSKSSLFLDKIRVSQASLNAFNTLFDQYIPMIGGLHGAQIGFLFDGLAFSSVLRVQDATATPSQKSVYHKAADLLAGLRASSRSLDDFKRIYSISIPFSGNISDISLRVKLIQIVTDPSAGVFSETAYIARLRQASAMLSGIRASESLLAQVNTLYGSSFRISGPLGESDIALLMQGIIAPGAFNQPVLANASDFLARMYADPDLERAFETIYGVLVPTAGSGTSAILRQTLIDMVSWASATGAPYVGNERHAFILKRAGSFLHFLRSTDKNRLVINTLFGTRYDSFAKTGIFKAVNRHQLLSDIASGVIKPEDLDSWAGPSRYELAYDLFQKMKISASHRIAFTNLYAINPGVGANVSVECRVILMGIVGYEFYDQSTFLGMMIRANSLFARIKASSVYRNAYNRRYANSIASLGATARDNRDHLYEIVTSPGYIENDFLKWLVQP